MESKKSQKITSEDMLLPSWLWSLEDDIYDGGDAACFGTKNLVGAAFQNNVKLTKEFLAD